MSVITNIFQISPKIWTQETLTQMFDKIIIEIEFLKKHYEPQQKIEKDENWLSPYEFIAKYPFASSECLANMRTTCQDIDQKFYKSASNNGKHPYVYNPIETFKHVMKFFNGKARIQNKLRENNFYGLKIED